MDHRNGTREPAVTETASTNPRDLPAADYQSVAMLPSLGIIRVTGPEAGSFLTAQFTNDVGALPESRSQLGAWCNAQGRVLVVFRLLRHEAAYVLVLPQEMIGSTLERLKKFVLRARLTLEEASEELRVLGSFGAQTLAGVAAHLPPIPEQENTVAHRAGVSVIRVPGVLPRWLIIGTNEFLAALRAKVPAADVPDTAWRLQDILAGIPMVDAATTEAFLPQMLNLDALGGLSFTKGCYPGQEVIARLQYRGQLKRRMYLALVEDAAAPRAGDRVYSRALLGSQPAGQIVSAAPRDSRCFALLAVVDNDSAHTGSIHLQDPDGPPLVFQPLPYPIDETGDLSSRLTSPQGQ
ncbi:MAG: YgfZ/GcvT domain-containing protein [Gammaproteobacteria bacterium]